MRSFASLFLHFQHVSLRGKAGGRRGDETCIDLKLTELMLSGCVGTQYEYRNHYFNVAHCSASRIALNTEVHPSVTWSWLMVVSEQMDSYAGVSDAAAGAAMQPSAAVSAFVFKDTSLYG